MKNKRKILFIIILFISFFGYSQKKTIKYYNEIGKEINKDEFIKTKNQSDNIDIYFKNDTIDYALLIKRLNFGKLEKDTFLNFKNYLSAISNTKIDSTKYLVINYLSSLPKKSENTKSKSGWNIFDKIYLERLTSKGNVQHFWVNSPENDNLEYMHYNEINWLSDKKKIFNKIFLKYNVKYGYFLIINPNREFIFYVGEYSKQQVWDLFDSFSKI